MVAEEGVSTEAALRLLSENKVEKLPIVDGAGKLVGLITVKDFAKREQYPHSAKDSSGRLLVAAGIGTYQIRGTVPVSWWTLAWMRLSSIPPTLTTRACWIWFLA